MGWAARLLVILSNQSSTMCMDYFKPELGYL